jgi:hypothetical protein
VKYDGGYWFDFGTGYTRPGQFNVPVEETIVFELHPTVTGDNQFCLSTSTDSCVPVTLSNNPINAATSRVLTYTPALATTVYYGTNTSTSVPSGEDKWGRALIVRSSYATGFVYSPTSTGTFSPAFSRTVLTYTSKVSNSVTDVNIQVNKASATATVTVATATSFLKSSVDEPTNKVVPASLAVGANVFYVTVTDSAVVPARNYILIITREQTNKLTALSVSSGDYFVGTLSPVFSGDTLGYTVDVPNNYTSVSISFTTHQDVAVLVTPPVGTAQTPSGTATTRTVSSLAVSVGANIFTLSLSGWNVTASTYTLTVNRLAAADSNVNLNDITPAKVKLTVAGDIATLNRATFDSQFKLDIATALNIVGNRIIINTITAGSVVVDFTILPSATSTVNPAAAIAALQAQIADPNSVLNAGVTTAGATGLIVTYSCPSGTQNTPCGGSSPASSLTVSITTILLTFFSMIYFTL